MHIAGTNDIRCPHCNLMFFEMTPRGGASANIRCSRCHLQFIFEHPLPVSILLRSASALLYEKWGYEAEQTRSLLEPLIEYVLPDGHPVLLWEKVKVFEQKDLTRLKKHARA